MIRSTGNVNGRHPRARHLASYSRDARSGDSRGYWPKVPLLCVGLVALLVLPSACRDSSAPSTPIAASAVTGHGQHAAAQTSASSTAKEASHGAKLMGGWSLEIVSKQAKSTAAPAGKPGGVTATLDHAVSVQQGVVVVVVRKGEPATFRATPTQGAAIEEAMLGIDFKKMALRVSLEEAIAGGTIYTFDVKRAGQTWQLSTGNIGGYPALSALISKLEAVALVP